MELGRLVAKQYRSDCFSNRPINGGNEGPMNDRCIITYAAGAHEEMLDVSLPTYKAFAARHGYDVEVGKKITDPPAWNKVPLLLDALTRYEEVVWFDCDLVVVNPTEDFPPMDVDSTGRPRAMAAHSLVRHFESFSEVPNTGVWRLRKNALELLNEAWRLQVFRDHGWWEQSAVMTLMGYTVPPQGSDFTKTRCRCVNPTYWHEQCQFMRVAWNSHPNYRADKPRIVHCSYPDVLQRIEVMRALVKNPAFEYPRYGKLKENNEGGKDN